MRTLKRTLAMVIAVAMVMTTFGITMVSAASYNDTQGHWAESYINTWSGYGVIQGDGGYFRPDDAITRAEVAQVTQNVISYVDKANNTFNDVNLSEWYADAVLKLVAAGTLTGNGDGTMEPGSYMTREQAMTMLARAYGLTVENSQAGITQYADYQNISDYATGYVGAMTAAGYINGYEDGTIRPQYFISRAEFVKILDNIIKLYITTPGTYGSQYVSGITMIKSGDVTINGIIGKGIVVSPQVNGNVTITNSQVSGNVVNLSKNATVTSNTGNVISPNGTGGSSNIVIGGNGNGNSNTSNNNATSYTVRFYYGDNYGKTITRTVTKNSKLSSSRVPTPSESDWDGYWYTSKSAAQNCSGTTVDPTTTRITRNYNLYAGHRSETSVTNVDVAVNGSTNYTNVYVGDVLSATNVQPTSAKNYVNYRWYRSSDSGYTAISGATKSTYTLTDEDAGKSVRLTITGTEDFTGSTSDYIQNILAKTTAKLSPETATSSKGANVKTTVKFSEGSTEAVTGVLDENGNKLSTDDYTVVDNVVTINGSYLSTLDNDSHKFTIVVDEKNIEKNPEFVVKTTGSSYYKVTIVGDENVKDIVLQKADATTTPISMTKSAYVDNTWIAYVAALTYSINTTFVEGYEADTTKTDTKIVVGSNKTNAAVVTSKLVASIPTETPSVTTDPTATTEPTATATTEPVATATTEPTATATTEPVATATTEPVATATTEPTATATTEPVATATTEPTATASTAPAVTATPYPTMPALSPISSDYTFIADSYNSAGTVKNAPFTFIDAEKHVYSAGNNGNNVSIKKKKSTINGTEYYNSMRLKGVQDCIAFVTSKDATVTVYGETHATRAFAAGTTLGGVEIAVGSANSGTFTFTAKANQTVYLTGVNVADNTGGDIYLAGFTVSFSSTAVK